MPGWPESTSKRCVTCDCSTTLAGSPGKAGPRKARQAAKRRPKGHKLPKAIAAVDVGQASCCAGWGVKLTDPLAAGSAGCSGAAEVESFPSLQ